MTTRMGFSVPLLALCLSASAFGSTLGVQNVLPADCSQAQFQSFCTQQAYADVDKGTRVDPPVLQPPLVATATTTGNTTFGETHATLFADGAYDSAIGLGPSASAIYSDPVQDYLITTSRVPNEFWKISFTIVATGSSIHDLTPQGGDDYSTNVALSIGIPGASFSCPNGASSGEIQGSASFNCIATVPVQTLASLSFYYEFYSQAQSRHGAVTLDRTSTIDYVSIVDANGVPDLNAQLFDLSGYNYNAPAVATPEPSTALLVFPLCLISIAATRRSAGAN